MATDDRPQDPTGGWAKATHAVAVFGKDALETGRALGRFVSGPAGELVGMLDDHLKVVRFERAVRLVDRIAEFMQERGKAHPGRPLPANIAVPLFDAATLEQDDKLQDLWARLLVNGTDADWRGDLQRSYISILRDMSRLDAQLLQDIGIADGGKGVWTARLPHAVQPVVEGEEGPEGEPPEEVQISLGNLTRLGVIDPTAGFGGPISRGLVRVTSLGRALLRACAP